MGGFVLSYESRRYSQRFLLGGLITSLFGRERLAGGRSY